MSGKTWLSRFAGITVWAVALTACAPGPTASPGITKQADAITIAMQQEPNNLMDNLEGSLLARTEVVRAAFAYPITGNEKGEYVALGAEQKPTTQNGLAKFVGTGADKHFEVTFKLKPQKWQDGQPVTADDIRFGWELMLNPKFPADDRNLNEKIWDMTVVDSRTVTAKFMSEAQALQAAAGNHPIMKDPKEYTGFKDWAGKGPVVDPLWVTAANYLQPKHVLASIPPDQMAKSDFARKPIYNGPYKVKEWVSGQQITMEAFGDFFLGAPKIKNLVFKFPKDSSVEIAQLRSGDYDVTTQIGLDLDVLPELQPLTDRFTMSTVAGTAWEHIDLNLSDPILQDIHVRRAIAYGINREGLVKNLMGGRSEVVHSFLPNWHPYLKPNENQVTKYNYDKAKAEQELKDAGYTKGSDGIYAKGGQKLKLKFQSTTLNFRKQTAQVLQKDLKEIGIEVDLDFLVARNFFAGAGKGPLSSRTYQLGMYTWITPAIPTEDSLYLGKNTPNKDNGFNGQNYPGYSGMDDLISQADFQGEIIVDEQKRIKLYGDMVKRWTTDLPVIPLFSRVNPIMSRKELKNFKPTKTSTPETWNSWEWEMPARS